MHQRKTRPLPRPGKRQSDRGRDRVTDRSGATVSYIGRHAELYDALYAEKPYAEEAAFVADCLSRFSARPVERALELACGTGNHALALEKLGYHIVATDNSPDMLARARAKAAAESASIELALMDMARFDAPAVPFDAILCLFNSIGYLLDNRDLESAFRCVAGSLRAQGIFIFEFWHAAALLRHFEPVRVKRVQSPGAQILRLSETSLNPAKSTARVDYTIFEFQPDGRYRQSRESQVNRYFSIPEMAAFLERAELEPLKWFDGYRNIEAIGETSWHIVCVARKKRDKGHP